MRHLYHWPASGGRTFPPRPQGAASKSYSRDAEERREIVVVLERLGTAAECGVAATRARAEDLHSRKFGIVDAAHVAFAEAGADFFISCDDRLVRKCRREKVTVTAMNPVEFTIAEDLK